MTNKKWSWEEVAEVIAASGEVLRHDRVAILADNPDDTYGDSGLYRPDMAKGAPLMGTVVAVGMGDAVKDDYYCGTRVQYNKYNVVEFLFDLEDMEDFQVVVLHDRDIYWTNDKANNVG